MNPHGITIAKIIPFELERIEEAAAKPDEVDAELLPFFEEEACAELQAIETVLRVWDGEPAEKTVQPLKELRRHFHTIKGAANSIGHLRIGALAGGMEDLCAQFNPAYAFVLRTRIIKTNIIVLVTIRSLMQEARQPQFCRVKKERVIEAAQSIVRLRERGMELNGMELKGAA